MSTIEQPKKRENLLDLSSTKELGGRDPMSGRAKSVNIEFSGLFNPQSSLNKVKLASAQPELGKYTV